MRIGIDARLWHETGVGRYIRNLVWNLHELDKTNTYVLFVSKGIKIEDLRLTNKNWHVVETDIHWHTVEEQLLFTTVLKNELLDLVHFPYFSVPLLYNKPFVITIHDLIINHFPTGKASTLPYPIYFLKLLAYKFVLKQAARKAQKVITVSLTTKDEIVKHLGISKDKVFVTYEGVENQEASIKKQVTSNKNHVANTKYFLYVGNAYPHKNLDRLIQSFVLVVKDYPDVKLVLVGKDDYFYKQLKKKVKELGLEKNILFAGFVSEQTLPLYYKDAVATIVPSLMEGFGLPGLEAMQNSSLVLASAIPTLKEIYQDAAVYFDPLAPESLHVTIQEVLRHKEKYHSYVEKGKKRASFFSWEKMAEETLKIYESSVGIRSGQ